MGLCRKRARRNDCNVDVGHLANYDRELDCVSACMGLSFFLYELFYMSCLLLPLAI